MGPLTKLAAIGFAGLALFLSTVVVRTVYRKLTYHAERAVVAATPLPAEASRSELEERADPILALASLTDFQKLATLNLQARAVNSRVKKILYWLYVAERKGIALEQAIDQAFAQNGNVGSPRASGAKAQTMANFRVAKRWGIFGPETLPKLKRGEAVNLTQGQWAGELIEIDHIVPLARYPKFGNELANLQLLPASQNRSKGDRMGSAEFQKLQELLKLSKPENSATLPQN